MVSIQILMTERDLILASNEYVFISDEAKGNIVNYVGPHKTMLAHTGQAVTFPTKKPATPPWVGDELFITGHGSMGI